MANITAVLISRRFERCRLQAWLDTVAQPPRWTIGWGYAGPDVREGMVWTQAEADANQVERLERAEAKVRTLITQPIGGGAIGALTSLADNAGIGIEIGSRLIAAVNAGDFVAAAHEFIDDDHVQGHEIRGLLKRRLYEAYYFLEDA